MNLFCKNQKSLSPQGRDNFDAINWENKKHVVSWYEQKHREMWGWCHETGEHKEDWPGWPDVIKQESQMVKESTVLFFYCFACCVCPIIWNDIDERGSNFPCERQGSPYRKWHVAYGTENTEGAKYWASIIAELPWSENGN